VLVAGARPNFVKVAPVHRALAALGVDLTLVHTGQHYDRRMSGLFFEQLGLPEPDVNLAVGSASHGRQTAGVLVAFEALLLARRPDLVVVFGDVNSTVACALAARKVPGVGLAHVEAGLRSFDRSMPEEVNRVVTDALADLLFTSEPSGGRNLLAEGVPAERIHFAGNVMIDSLLARREAAARTGAVAAHGLEAGRYALLTLHRPGNVDRERDLKPLLDAVADIAAERLPVLYPVHPRSRPAVETWRDGRGRASRLILVEPLGYLEFLDLLERARLVMTDSGGIQEETTALGVPCLTLRPTTERPVTVDEGTNTLVGRDPERLKREVDAILAGRGKSGRVPPLWDGHAAERIARVIAAWDGRLR
jgi:UDP-N-acetylglucosamine 2-epimerase (non-hydrolysing)